MDFEVFALAVASALLHALWNFASKKGGGRPEVMFLGQAVVMVVLLPVAVWQWPRLALLDLYYIGMTGALQAAYFFTLAGAYRTGEISAVYPVARAVGILVSLAIGIAFAGDRVSPLGLAGIVTTVAGTLPLIGRSLHGRALGYAVLTGAAAGGSYLYGKLAVARMPVEFYVWSLAVMGGVFLAPFFSRLRRPLPWRESALVGIGSTASYLLALYAFRRGNMSYVVPVRECSVVFGSLLGVVFLGEPLGRRKALAIAAVVAGAVCIKLA